MNEIKHSKISNTCLQHLFRSFYHFVGPDCCDLNPALLIALTNTTGSKKGNANKFHNQHKSHKILKTSATKLSTKKKKVNANKFRNQHESRKILKTSARCSSPNFVGSSIWNSILKSSLFPCSFNLGMPCP